jgi:hypothetical protein
MKVGDLVKRKQSGRVGGPHGYILRIDKDYYGARQAFKISNPERGKCLRPDMVDMIAPTERGIRDRVLVMWLGDRMEREYVQSDRVEVVSEGG